MLTHMCIATPMRLAASGERPNFTDKSLQTGEITMKRYTFIFPLVCAVALLASCEKKSAVTYEYTTVTRGSVQNTVSAVGTLSATATVSVQGSASGIVDEIFVQAGDGVQRGQKIADINTTGNPNQRQLSAVYSPIDGVVSDIPLGIGGAVLGRGSPAATTLFTLTSHTDTLVINAPVGELDIGSLSVGQEAKITLQSAPGKTYTSKISRILPLATTTDKVNCFTICYFIPILSRKIIILTSLLCNSPFLYMIFNIIFSQNSINHSTCSL